MLIIRRRNCIITSMRVDKFLKVSRILKRRTVACEAADGGKVSVNGKTAKPSLRLKIGDIVEITFGSGILKFEVLALNEKANAEQAKDLYRVLQ